MSLFRILHPRISCSACSQSARRTVRLSHFKIASSAIQSSRTFAFTSCLQAGQDGSIDHDPSLAFLQTEEPFLASKEEDVKLAPQAKESSTSHSGSVDRNPTSAAASSPLPWYLQGRPPPTPVQAADVPDLPVNPPPLLATLLGYLSMTAGLDNISLLDLRSLNPPPALGSKLIMLICTARSEKHLHVSADRLCRWLRRDHGVKADAAGLLGRNELKIKLRRKMKRMKLMANVGARETEGQANIDDGIRTNWICTTLSKIPAHPLDAEVPGDDAEGFVGFADVKPGVNVVIQMFTEEKRVEVDLECLWNGIMRTGRRKDLEADDKLRGVFGGAAASRDAAQDPASSGVSASNKSDKTRATPPHAFNKPRPGISDVFPPPVYDGRWQQPRRLHTSVSGTGLERVLQQQSTKKCTT